MRLKRDFRLRTLMMLCFAVSGQLPVPMLRLALSGVLGYSIVGWGQAQNEWTTVGSMLVARTQHTATLLNDGRVLIAGGDCEQPAQISCGGTAEIYDPTSKRFSKTGSMVDARFNHAATLLPDGRVLIAGGMGARRNLTTVEIYDPQTGRFSANGDLKLECGMCSAALLDDGRVVVTGWNPGQIYDPRNLSTTVLAGAEFSATRPLSLPNQRILFAGGSSNSVSIYDLRANTFQRFDYPFPSRIFAGIYDSVTALIDGSVLITGGAPDGTWSSATNSATLYRPETGEFVLPPTMSSMRDFRNAHTSTSLPDGSVLLVGGNEGGGMTGSFEVLDPERLRFQLKTPAPVRASHTATLLPDGSLLVVGGSVEIDYIGLRRRILSTAELYEPAVKIRSATIHTLPEEGATQGAVLNGGTSRVASRNDPAVAGEVLEIYVGGLAENGKILPRVSIGGLACELLFLGAAPGYPALFQINVRVPQGVAPGGAVPVRLIYLDRPSNEVTIATQ